MVISDLQWLPVCSICIGAIKKLGCQYLPNFAYDVNTNTNINKNWIVFKTM